jgi:hypothetical protein
VVSGGINTVSLSQLWWGPWRLPTHAEDPERDAMNVEIVQFTSVQVSNGPYLFGACVYNLINAVHLHH